MIETPEGYVVPANDAPSLQVADPAASAAFTTTSANSVPVTTVTTASGISPVESAVR